MSNCCFCPLVNCIEKRVERSKCSWTETEGRIMVVIKGRIKRKLEEEKYHGAVEFG